MPTYRTFCPDCKKPMAVPCWVRCSKCDKILRRARARAKYPTTAEAKIARTLYNRAYRKANAERINNNRRK